MRPVEVARRRSEVAPRGVVGHRSGDRGGGGGGGVSVSGETPVLQAANTGGSSPAMGFVTEERERRLEQEQEQEHKYKLRVEQDQEQNF